MANDNSTPNSWTGQVDAKAEKGCATGFKVGAGDVLRITASGSAQRSTGKSFGPDGDAGYERQGLLFQDAPVGALIMRIGQQYFPVKGKLPRWTAPADGDITFFFNDVPGGGYHDNKGGFDVQVEKIWYVDAQAEKGRATGFTVKKGDVLTIAASGSAQRSTGKEFGPDGDAGYQREGLLLQDAPVGALVMKIGDRFFPVKGRLSNWTAPADGEITFFFNDVPGGGYKDNKGGFDVRIEKAPPPIWTGRVDAKAEKGSATGAKVKKGDVLTITASGTAQRATGKGFGPEGDASYQREGLLFQDAPVGALIMTIGQQHVPVKSKLSNWPVPVDGEITFFFNDVPGGGYSDNKGAFEVEIQQVSAA